MFGSIVKNDYLVNKITFLLYLDTINSKKKKKRNRDIE